MKQIKLSFAILAMLLIAISSFTTKANNGIYFYEFRGDVMNPNQVMDYYYYVSVPFACDSWSGELCGIYLSNYYGLGEHPNPSEFEQYAEQLSISALLWMAVDPAIKMK